MNKFGRSQRMGEFSAPTSQLPEEPDDGDALDVDGIANSLMAAPVGAGTRLVSRTWETIRIEGLVDAPAAGVRHGSAKIKINGTEFDADLEAADEGGFRVWAEIEGLDVPPGTHRVTAELTGEHGDSGTADLGQIRAVDRSRSSSMSGHSSRASASSSRQASSLATADDNAIFGLSRAQAAVGTVGVGVAGAVLLSLL